MRVVYDGAPEAGKTTNIQKLCDAVALQRRGDFKSPGTDGRRTEYFDWLDFAGGYVDGRKVRCQIVSVPGQSQLLHRRRYLLNTADAVVFVADSRPDYIAPNLDSMTTTLRILESLSEGAQVGIVLQANKQDLEGALAPRDLAVAFQFPSSGTVLGARAHTGEGVMQSFIMAVRVATDRIRKLAMAGLLAEGEWVEQETPEALYATMLRAETAATRPTPRHSIQARDVAPDLTHDSSPPPTIPVTREPLAPALIMDLQSLANDAGRMPPEIYRSRVPTIPAGHELPASSPAIDSDDPEAPQVPVRRNPTAREPTAPPLVSELGAGHIWPPTAGRKVLADAGLDACTAPENLSTWAEADASELVTASGHTLHSRPGWSFSSEHEARMALMGLVRTHLRVTALLPAGRVLFMAKSGLGFRIWMATPKLVTMREMLDQAVLQGSTALVTETLMGVRSLAERMSQLSEEADRALLPASLECFGRAATGDWSLLSLPQAQRPQTAPEFMRTLLAPLAEAARHSAAVQSLLREGLLGLSANAASAFTFLDGTAQ